MRRTLVIVRTGPALLGTRVVIRANDYSTVVFNSLLGERIFYLSTGKHLEITLKGRM